MEKQTGEFVCTNCRETAVLVVGDDTPFKCQDCSGEECEMNFVLEEA